MEMEKIDTLVQLCKDLAYYAESLQKSIDENHDSENTKLNIGLFEENIQETEKAWTEIKKSVEESLLTKSNDEIMKKFLLLSKEMKRAISIAFLYYIDKESNEIKESFYVEDWVLIVCGSGNIEMMKDFYSPNSSLMRKAFCEFIRIYKFCNETEEKAKL